LVSFPNTTIAALTVAVNPAAGPLTLNAEPLNKPTTTPPIMPAIIPEKIGIILIALLGLLA
jgi:hypothetical protein